MTTSSDSHSWYQDLLDGESDEASELYQILADERRRVLLNVLDQSNMPVTELELARLVASHELGNTPENVTFSAQERVQISLHHVHLPRLEAHGLIERTTGGSITRTQHSFWTDSDLRTLLTEPDVDPAIVTATLDLLTSHQCRETLAFLHDYKNTTIGKLAEELAGTPISGQEIGKVLIALRHRHLPKLAAANVIEMDATGVRVRYMGNDFLERWFTELQRRR